MEKYELNELYLNETPKIDETAFIAQGARVMGRVVLGKQASVWYNSVLRGDINEIRVGDRSNIQDLTMIHVENDRACIVGSDVTVGHNAILHGCTIEDACLIGMGAVILNGAVIGKGSIVAAGAVVKENMIVPPQTMVAGVPAKVIKSLPDSIIDVHIKWALKYTQIAKAHKEKIS